MVPPVQTSGTFLREIFNLGAPGLLRPLSLQVFG